MKTILNIFIICIAPLVLTAQEEDRHKDKKISKFYLNIGTDVHLNSADVKNETLSGYEVMSTKNNLGSRIGAEYHMQRQSGFVFATGIDYRYAAQKVMLNYNSGEMGFSNTNVQHTQGLRFVMHNIDPYVRFGYAMPLKKKNSNLEFSLGAITSVLVTAFDRDVQTVSLNITDNEYKDIVYNYDAHEGSFSIDVAIPMNPIVALQVVYNTEMFGKAFKAGVDLKRGTNKFNDTEVRFYGAGRSDAGISTYADRYQSIGMFIGVGL